MSVSKINSPTSRCPFCPGVGQADDLGPGGLGLEQVGGEVRRGQRVAHGAEDLPAQGGHEFGGVLLQGLAEGVVGRDEEPGLATMLDDGLPGPFAQGVGVVNVVDAVGGPGLVGQIRASRTRIHGDPLLVARDFLYRQSAT